MSSKYVVTPSKEEVAAELEEKIESSEKEKESFGGGATETVESSKNEEVQSENNEEEEVMIFKYSKTNEDGTTEYIEYTGYSHRSSFWYRTTWLSLR